MYTIAAVAGTISHNSMKLTPIDSIFFIFNIQFAKLDSIILKYKES